MNEKKVVRVSEEGGKINFVRGKMYWVPTNHYSYLQVWLANIPPLYSFNQPSFFWDLTEEL
jgi:hypothetical protein